MPRVKYKGQRFTDRQVEVLKELGAGRSNGEIALNLFMSKRTVECHITNIRRIFSLVEGMQIGDRYLVLLAKELLDAFNIYNRTMRKNHASTY